MTETVTLRLHPWLAALLSLLIPGMGEMYCGRRAQGLWILVLSILGLYLCGLAPILSAAHAWRLAARLGTRAVPAARPSGGSGLGEALSDLLD